MIKKATSVITNKEKILSSLLEDAKTQTKLLIELGYKSNQHKNISKDLKTLKTWGFITDQKIKSEAIDEDCTLWSIVPKYENFECILKKYESLFSKMQKSNMVLEAVFENTLVYSYKYIKSLDREGKFTINVEKREMPLPARKKEDFKKKLRLSPEYFRLNIFNHDSELKKHGFDDFAETLEMLQGDHRIFGYQYDTVFKVCVLVDMLKGKSSEEAKRYLIEMEKNKS